MRASPPSSSLSRDRATKGPILVVGAGGLASPILTILARSIDASLTIIDDDVVDETNLHRQILFGDRDVGRPKLEAARERALAEAERAGHRLAIRTIEGRFTPENARALAQEHALIVEGADNLATKFLAADAAHLAGRAIVQAGVVRWVGWAFASAPGTACLRCVFEDVPRDRVETCATAGVVGSVVGAVGALAASLVVRLALGDEKAAATLHHHDAMRGTLGRTRVRPRPDCPLCGERASIQAIDEARYLAPSCAG
ncbi:MAG: ThiF family adenylyltransferase [Sandaracinus sp.]